MTQGWAASWAESPADHWGVSFRRQFDVSQIMVSFLVSLTMGKNRFDDDGQRRSSIPSFWGERLDRTYPTIPSQSRHVHHTRRATIQTPGETSLILHLVNPGRTPMPAGSRKDPFFATTTPSHIKDRETSLSPRPFTPHFKMALRTSNSPHLPQPKTRTPTPHHLPLASSSHNPATPSKPSRSRAAHPSACP